MGLMLATEPYLTHSVFKSVLQKSIPTQIRQLILYCSRSQVLYINMITSVTMGLMLAMEPAEDDIMTRPPRRQGKRLFGKMVPPTGAPRS